MTDTMIDDRWARQGIDADHTQVWLANGLDADAAAVWNHYRVAPAAARAWERAGFHGGDLPSRAALWHHNAFTPREALAWGALPDRCSGPWVFPPSIALLFRDAGFTAARAWPWWQRGFTASLAGKWREAGLSVAVAERWINGGFDNPDIAASWIEAGATPAEAAMYLRARPDADEALVWRERGFDHHSIGSLGGSRFHRRRRTGLGGPVDPTCGGRRMAGGRVQRGGGVHVAGAASRTGRGAGVCRARTAGSADGGAAGELIVANAAARSVHRESAQAPRQPKNHALPNAFFGMPHPTVSIRPGPQYVVSRALLLRAYSTWSVR
jgi:hypothetical protein